MGMKNQYQTSVFGNDVLLGTIYRLKNIDCFKWQLYCKWESQRHFCGKNKSDGKRQNTLGCLD